MPSFGADAGVADHVLQLLDAVVGECGDGFGGTGIDADDVAITAVCSTKLLRSRVHRSGHSWDVLRNTAVNVWAGNKAVIPVALQNVGFLARRDIRALRELRCRTRTAGQLQYGGYQASKRGFLTIAQVAAR